MHYQVQLYDSSIRENQTIKDFIRRYPKTTNFIIKLEIDNNWKPGDFGIKKFEMVSFK